MVSLTDNRSNHFLSSENPSSSSMATQNLQQKPAPKSMRTLRSKLFPSFDAGNSTGIADGKFSGVYYPESSGIIEALATASPKPDFLDLSQAFSDFSAYTTSDISGELERLAARPGWELNGKDLGFVDNADLELDLGLGFLKPETTEIIENLDPEMIERAVKTCVTGLRSGSIAVNRCSARKLRLLAKNRPENRELIARTGAIPLLVSLLTCNDPLTQENAVTALLNLSLHENNKTEITAAGAIKPLIYVLKTGTAISKQNSACTLLSLSFIEDNKVSIGVSGAIPLLVALLINGSIRGKKDALTTLYKLCSIEQNKERAIRAGVVKQLVELMSYQSSGMVDKAAVVLNSMAGVKEGKIAIVKEGGIPVLVEVIEEGSLKGKEFAVATLLQLCSESRSNRTLLVREGGIPPLVALSQLGTSRAKHKALILLRYLREPREGEQRLRTSLQEKLDASSSS